MSEEVKKGLTDEVSGADAAATEIGSDLDALIAMVSNPNGLTAAEAEEVRVQLAALRAKLTGEASKFTP